MNTTIPAQELWMKEQRISMYETEGTILTFTELLEEKELLTT